MKRLIACLALLLGLFGVMDAQDATPTSKGLLIEIDCFSGRPNPKFIVTDPEQIANIKALLDGCVSRNASDAETPVITEKLGYRGIKVSKLDDTNVPLGSIYAFDVNKDKVLMYSKKPDSRGIMTSLKQAHTDASAALEHYLLELALSQGQLNTTSVDKILRR